MKKPLFAGAAAAMIVAVSPAFARMDDMDCMPCGNDRSIYSIPTGAGLAQHISVCRTVKEAIATKHGHVMYRTRQVCH
jgi:hypothetical protein